jgi:hypothetical protein
VTWLSTLICMTQCVSAISIIERKNEKGMLGSLSRV